jgi:hypothetical protein
MTPTHLDDSAVLARTRKAGEAPRLSFVVMTHPKRLARARAVVAEHPELDARIVVDPEPDGPPVALRTARLAWAAADPAATHHVVLQDDVVLARDVRHTLEEAVRSRPHAALSLFTHWGSHLSYAARLAALGGLAWTESIGGYTPTQALVLPMPEAVEAVHAFDDVDTRHDDVAMRRHLCRRGVECLLAVPNLVEHRDLPSLSGNDSHGIRRSVCFADRPGMAGDWDAPTLRPTMLPYVERLSGRLERHVWAAGNREHPVVTDPHAELNRYGFGPPALRRALTERLRSQATLSRRSAIGSDALLALWGAAHLLGIAAGIRYGATDPSLVERAVNQAKARMALGTMGPGALRQQVSVDALSLVRESLASLVSDGVVAGWLRVADEGV